MSDVELVSTGSSGLDLVLGGGLALLDRGGAASSGSLLIRGDAGAGKTILAIQLAAHIARHRGGDVPYGCVELLPVELAAQHQSVFAQDEAVGSVAVVAADAAAQKPFGERDESTPTAILAAVLDMGTGPREHEHLGAAVDALLAACERSGSNPSVLVVDSLVGSYGLGADAPRGVVDGLVKLAAERGLFLIVAEESGTESGEWRFAVDTVIELQHGPAGPSRISERDLFVTKHRFAPSVVGPHPYFLQQGLRVAPSLRAYSGYRAQLPLRSIDTSWNVPELDASSRWQGDPSDGVSLVYGTEPYAVRRLAEQLAASKSRKTLFLDFGAGDRTIGPLPDLRLALADPQLGAEQFLGSCRLVLERNPSLGRILVGDLGALKGFADPEGLQRAVATLAEVVRGVIPFVMFLGTEDVRPPIIGWPDFTIRVTAASGFQGGVELHAWARNGDELIYGDLAG